MLRRPPTSIELKLDDVSEYENLRRELETAKEPSKISKPYNEPPTWQPGPKTKQEIHNRIGYVAPNRSPTNNQ